MTALSTTFRSFHVCLDLDYILNAAPDEAGTMLKDAATGSTLTSDEAKTLAVIAKAKGYTVLPMCKSHDGQGYCLGHEIKE